MNVKKDGGSWFLALSAFVVAGLTLALVFEQPVLAATFTTIAQGSHSAVSGALTFANSTYIGVEQVGSTFSWKLLAFGCAASTWVSSISATGTPTCSQPRYTDLLGRPFNATTGLLAYWNMDEAQGTKAYDYSGGLNTGTLTNTPTWSAGKYGSGLSFAAASSQYVSVGNPADLKVQHLSIVTWMQFDGTNGQFSFVGHGSGGYGFFINNKALGFQTVAVSNIVISSTTLTGNTWYCVGVTYDGSQGIIYLNGVQDAVNTNAQTFTFSNGLYLGADSTGGEYLNGQMDGTLIWDHVLTGTEMNQACRMLTVP